MGSVSVSAYRCCVCVSCVHPVAILNATFCMTCSLLMLVEDGRGIPRTRSHDCLVGSHECLPHPVTVLLLFVEVCVHVLRCCECVCCM